MRATEPRPRALASLPGARGRGEAVVCFPSFSLQLRRRRGGAAGRCGRGVVLLRRPRVLNGEGLDPRDAGVSLRCAPGRASRAVGNDTTVANGAEPPARQASPPIRVYG